MIIDRPGIDEEFLILHKNPTGPVFWNYRAEFIINGKTYPAPKVDFVNISRRYKDDTAEVIMIGVKVDLRLYENIILESARNFDVKLIRRLSSPDGIDRESDQRFFRVYRGFLDVTPDTKMTKATRDGDKQLEENLGGLIDVNIQLIDKTVYEMSLTRIRGVVRGTSLKDTIRYFFSYGLGEVENKKMLVDKNYQEVRGVEIYEPDNKDPNPFFLLESSIPLIELPQYLQKRVGVYSSGMGYFYQDGWWHIYPLYRTNRFAETKKTLTLLCIPKEEMPTSERSYLYRSEQLFIFSHGERISTDTTEKAALSNGNQIRFWKSDDLIDGMYSVKDNVVTPKIEETQREISLRNRSEGKQKIVQYPGNFINNGHRLSTSMVGTKGRYLTTVWVNCDSALIYPGMPSKILYVEGDDLVEVLGTLISVDIQSTVTTEHYMDRTFVTTAVLTFYIDEDVKRKD